MHLKSGNYRELRSDYTVLTLRLKTDFIQHSSSKIALEIPSFVDAGTKSTSKRLKL
jgi:hypothetical protein